MKESLGLFLGAGLAASYVLLLRANTRLYAQTGRAWLAVGLHIARVFLLVFVLIVLGLFGKRFLINGLIGFVPTHLVLYLWLRRQPDDLASP